MAYRLQPDKGLLLSSGERNAIAIAAKGQTASSRRPTMRRRKGAIVTDMMAICKPNEKKREISLKRHVTNENYYSISVPIMPFVSVIWLQPGLRQKQMKILY